MIPIDAFNDAAYKANNGITEETYIFDTIAYRKQFQRMLESTWRMHVKEFHKYQITITLR